MYLKNQKYYNMIGNSKVWNLNIMLCGKICQMKRSRIYCWMQIICILHFRIGCFLNEKIYKIRSMDVLLYNRIGND